MSNRSKMKLPQIYVPLIIATVQVATCEAMINGIPNSEIINLIKSQLSDWSDVSEGSVSAEFKLKKDKRIIKRILASYGYFDAQICPKLQKGKAMFNIELNERYKFDDVLLLYIDQRNYRSGLKVKQVFDLIGIPYDTYTDTKQLSDGCEKIADFLRGKGFAFVQVRAPKLQRDKKDKRIKAIYEIELNGKTVIDKTIVNIKSKKDPNLLKPFVRNRISWKNGDIYDREKIENMKNEIMESKIFSGVSVVLSEPTKDKNDSSIVHTTITIDLEEALLRDVGAGLKYGSSEKFGILLSWTHYNINGKGSSLATSIDASKENRYLRIKYDTYDLFYKRQKLSTQAFYVKEDESSYKVLKSGAESMLWQTFDKKLHAGLGLCIEESETTDKIEKKDLDFSAVGIPMGLKFDTTDEYLDPQKGIRCQAMVTPYIGRPHNVTVFTGKASIYIPFKKNAFQNFLVLAVYSRYGTIFRNKNHDIPRDKLFFSGGANSIRGYGYQKVGAFSDVDEGDEENKNNKPLGKPLGGESVFEIGIEPRIRVSDNLGFVAFVEGGNVYTKKMANPLRKLFFGYGVGIRYYTSFAPIRFDIAFPTKIRKTKQGKKIDSMFNLYLSIGQAF